MKAPLKELAEAAGLLLEWENSDGEPCQLSEQAQRNLLDALGYSTASESAIEEGLQRLKSRCPRRCLPAPRLHCSLSKAVLNKVTSTMMVRCPALPRSAITSCR